MKFYGKIGFSMLVEEKPDVWKPRIVERSYYGDWLRRNLKTQTSDKVNDDLTIANELSIVADPYANLNYGYMRYAVVNGVKWKITSVDATQFPRLVLSIGGVYNGKTT